VFPLKSFLFVFLLVLLFVASQYHGRVFLLLMSLSWRTLNPGHVYRPGSEYHTVWLQSLFGHFTSVCRDALIFCKILVCTYIYINQNYFPEPNQHKLDILHLILLCRMAYRAPIAGDYTDVCKLQYITRGVSHCGLAIHIKKYLKAKEESWKFKYFTMQKCNLQ
jgi:hypothetical protein